MLSGKLAVVTGAGSGIGRATCLVFAREGASVITSDKDAKTADETLNLLQDTCGNHMSLRLDVSNHNEVSSALSTVTERYAQPPNILVNSAGITRDAFFLKMTAEQFQQVIDVNMKGTFSVTQAFCAALIRSQLGGCVVNIASLVGQTGNMGQANYSASKAGVEAFTKTVAKEMGLYNIRCNAVVPGFIQSPMTEAVPEKVREMFRANIPMKRLGKAEEVAEVIAFLASVRSSYVNGASVQVTGGM